MVRFNTCLGLVSGGTPNYHGGMESNRGFSAELVNLTTPLESGFTSSTPTEPTTAAKVRLQVIEEAVEIPLFPGKINRTS